MKVPQSLTLERTGWRDEELSRRHRLWGFDCPGVDIDFLLVEYSEAVVKALVEYKCETAPPPDFQHPNYRALVDLANKAAVPAFSTRYTRNLQVFVPHPLNLRAERYVPEPMDMTEEQWVRLLYRIRGRSMPSGLFEPSSENGPF